jgi:hypothetical protein
MNLSLVWPFLPMTANGTTRTSGSAFLDSAYQGLPAEISFRLFRNVHHHRFLRQQLAVA